LDSRRKTWFLGEKQSFPIDKPSFSLWKTWFFELLDIWRWKTLFIGEKTSFLLWKSCFFNPLDI
jgi:hypothetical protein